MRLALLPLYLWMVFGLHSYVWAGFLLGVLGATDWVDGKLARHLGQVSAVGKVLDPVVDRLLMFSAVVTVGWVHAAPLWFVGQTLARELLVSLATLAVAALGGRRIDVLWVGKAGTFGLMCAYPWFLMSHGPAAWQSALHVAAWAVGIPAAILSWAALVSYVGPAREALAQGRSARRDGGGPAPLV